MDIKELSLLFVTTRLVHYLFLVVKIMMLFCGMLLERLVSFAFVATGIRFGVSS